MAVGLGVAVSNTITVDHDHLKVQWDHVPLVVALLVTLVPFYQGAMLHLDGKYLRDEVGSHATLVPLVDFAFLFLEAVLVVALAASVADVRPFLVAGAALLAIDVVWAIVAFRLVRRAAAPDERQDNASNKAPDGELHEWIVINAVSLVIFGIGCLGQLWIDYPTWVLTTVAVAAAIIRSTVDYRKNAPFYAGEE
jgi:hypothetical protein